MDQNSYNRLTAKVLILEEENKRQRRALINCFKLICSIGVETGCIPEKIARRVTEDLG